tara:strand:+ start:47 stop:646 length:600 start_codon:yes stop_codon:yes gene_type:complete
MISIFPTILHDFKSSDYNKEELVNFCYSEKKRYPEGMEGRSNYGNSWHSSDHYMEEDNLISSIIFSSINSYFNDREILKEESQYCISNAWVNINSKGGSNSIHYHPGSSLSGVFWINVPKDSGELVFKNPNNFVEASTLSRYADHLTASFNKYETFYLEPKEGYMVLFPSHIQHLVRENKSNEDRIAISFNIVIKYSQD